MPPKLTFAARVAAGATGAFLTVGGVLFLAVPGIAASLFALNEPGGPWLAATGVRELAFGLILLLLAPRGEARSLAAVLLVGALVPVVDAALVWQSSGFVASLRHLAAIPICLALAAAFWQNRRP